MTRVMAMIRTPPAAAEPIIRGSFSWRLELYSSVGEYQKSQLHCVSIFESKSHCALTFSWPVNRIVNITFCHCLKVHFPTEASKSSNSPSPNLEDVDGSRLQILYDCCVCLTSG